MKLPRWLGNAPIDEYRTLRHDTDGDVIDQRAQREFNRGNLANPREHDYSVTLNVGGFSGVSIPWGGTSLEDARDSFLVYLCNHNDFGLSTEVPNKFFRSLHANFNGRHVLFTFRTSWITGFAIS